MGAIGHDAAMRRLVVLALALTTGQLQLGAQGTRTWTASGHYATEPGEIAQVRRTRGVLPIANGRAFAYVGYGEPANRLFMITGPGYQTPGRNHAPNGRFGQVWIEVVDAEGKPLQPDRRGWEGIPRAAAAKTWETFTAGDRLETVDVALGAEDDTQILLRKVRFTAAGPGRRLVLHHEAGGLQPTLLTDHGPLGLVGSDGDGQDRAWLSTTWVGTRARPSREGLPAVDVGEETVVLLVPLVLSHDQERGTAILRALLDAPDALNAKIPEAVASWQSELEGTLTASPAGPLRDHLEAVKLLTLAQRSSPHGGVAPMVSFKGVWARDSNGPLKTFLWMGRFDLAADLLTYYRRASARAKATHREYPLDLDVGPEDFLTPAEWATTGTDRCEVPSYIALQHAWYYAATGDRELLREAWPYVLRNVTHQQTFEGPHGPLQRFNGDETYLHGAFYSLFPQKDVWPNHLPRVSAYSLDSLLAWDAALHQTARLARTLQHDDATAAALDARRAEVRRSIEETFWLDDLQMYAPALSPLDLSPHATPFAPLALRPLWLGTHAPDDPRALANLRTTLTALGRDDGLCDMTESLSWSIGTLPGYWLANLTAVDHPLAWEIVDEVLATASPAGAWAEIHQPDGPSWGYGDGTLPNRFRPWESGLVMDAVLRFLTGMQTEAGARVTLKPRKPRDLELEMLGPLRVGDTRFVLRYPSDPQGKVEVVHLEGPPLQVNGEELALGGLLEVPLAQPAAYPAQAPWSPPSPLAGLAKGTRLIVTTADPGPLSDGDVLLDAGLPFTPTDLAAALLADDAPRYRTLVLGPSALHPDRETLKPARFWTDPALAAALTRFEQLGGRIERPSVLADWLLAGPFPNPESKGLFLEQRPLTEPFDRDAVWPVDGQPVDARWHPRHTADGRMDLHLRDGPQDDVCVFARSIVASATARDATLLLGTDDGCRVWLNGELVFESIEHRHLTPDQFRIPIQLREGDNVLVVGVEDRFGGFGLAARIR